MTPASPTARLAYLDVLRGLAVLVMVLAHVVDAWTADVDRAVFPYYTSVFIGGLGAPLFLLLAGVAQAMSAGSKARRTDDPDAGSLAIWRRGWEVFALALVFRLQSLVLGWGAFRNLLKVDILNTMGLSMVGTAILWRLGGTRGRRFALFAAATAAVTFATPVVRSVAWLSGLPDPLEAYLRPTADYAAFPLLPWAGFLFAGVIVGMLIDAARLSGGGGWRLHAPLLAAAVGGVGLAWWASFQPSLYAHASFWTSSPTFFFIRLGLVTLAVPAAWAHCEFWLGNRRRLPEAIWRPGVAVTRAVELMGRSSLFVYWIHVEMVYGLVAGPLKRTLSLPGSLAATLLMCGLLYGIVRLKNRWMEGTPVPPRMRLMAAVLR